MRALRQSVVRAWAEATEGVRIALSALVGARLRSFLTTLGIVIGVMTVIAIVAIIQGLNASFETQMANLGANTVYVSKWKWFSTNDDWWEYRNRQNVGTAELRAVEEEALSAVSVAPMANQLGTLVTYLNHSVENVRTIGTSPRYLDTNGGNVFAGRFLSDPDVQLSRNSAVLGAEVAQRLFEGVRPEEILGRHVLVNGVRFTVIGTMARRGRMLGMDMDVNVLVPYTTLLRDFGSKRSIIIAVAGEPGKLAQLEDELTGILRRLAAGPLSGFHCPPAAAESSPAPRPDPTCSRWYHRRVQAGSGTAVLRLVCFTLGSQELAFPIGDVRETVPLTFGNYTSLREAATTSEFPALLRDGLKAILFNMRAEQNSKLDQVSKEIGEIKQQLPGAVTARFRARLVSWGALAGAVVTITGMLAGCYSIAKSVNAIAHGVQVVQAKP